MSTKPDNWDDVQYECIKCGDTHHPSKREPHAFRLQVTTCPQCGATRARITHDLDGPVSTSSG